jgi:hypothetical protein
MIMAVTRKAVARYLVELSDFGVVEDTGQRRTSPTGESQICWRVSALGQRVFDYMKWGFTFEQALSKANGEQSGSVVPDPRYSQLNLAFDFRRD